MLLASGQAGQLAAAHAIYGVIHGYGVLHRSLHARYPAHGVGMPLAQALAPESICSTLWKNRLAEKPVKRKQAGIPANRGQGRIAARARRRIDRSKVFGDFCVCIETIDGIE